MTPLMPVVNGVSGDLAGIAVSKLSTELHAERRHRVRAELRAAAAAKAQPQLQLQHAHSTDSVSSALSEAPETCGRSCCAEFESPAATFCAFSCAHMSIYEHSDALCVRTAPFCSSSSSTSTVLHCRVRVNCNRSEPLEAFGGAAGHIGAGPRGVRRLHVSARLRARHDLSGRLLSDLSARRLPAGARTALHFLRALWLQCWCCATDYAICFRCDARDSTSHARDSVRIR